MVALWNRADHYIFDAVVCYFFFFFPRLNSQPPQIGCLSYLHTWCGLSANLRSRSETCCTRLAEKNRTQKCRQKSPSGHYRTSLSGYIFATEARIDNRKNLLSSNMSSTFPPQYGELRPLAAQIGLPVWGTPANFNGFRILVALLHGSQVVSVSQTLRR